MKTIIIPSKVEVDDFESIAYPSLDNKRMIIDKVLAQKINEIIDYITEKENI